MEIKNYQLIGYNEILISYYEKRLPQKISYAITKNLMVFATEMDVYQKMLQRVLDDYKDYYIKDDTGNIKYYDSGLPMVQSDHEEEYMHRVEELLNNEIEVPIYKIDESLFSYEDSDRYDSLSAADIMRLTEVLC